MYKKKRILALITARGGSKGLPGKNIKPLAGKPLLAWSVEQGLASPFVDKLAISTDDRQIAAVAKKYGAEVPFIRPAHLASDQAKSIDVIEHALNHYRAAGQVYDYLLLLEPTSPLREVEDINLAIKRLIDNKVGANSLVSVTKVESSHPDFMVKINGRNLLEPYKKTFKVLRRQELDDVYYFEGTVYFSEINTLLKKRTFYHDRTLAYVVPKWQAFEIDDLIDYYCTEAIIEHKAKIKALGTVSRRA